MMPVPNFGRRPLSLPVLPKTVKHPGSDIRPNLYVRERVERGRREADQEKLLDQDDVEVRMNRT